MSWWEPARHADRRPILLERNRIIAELRAWFAREGFVEVDPAALQVSPGNEVHLHAFATEAVDGSGAASRRYLHTSPEFAMKKLLAAGERKIFALSHVWRNGESGPLHAPEFTMLEWYRAEAGYERLMEDCAAVMRLAAPSGRMRHGGLEADMLVEPERLDLADAVARATGIDLLATLAPDGTPDTEALAAQMRSQGLRVREGEDWSDLLSAILATEVEPGLGAGRPAFLDRYPAPEAALARRCADDLRLAERFELFVCGVELANGFGELTDAVEQRRRFEADMAERERRYGTRYPLDEDFLKALEIMPEACGIALGLDRLVMLATGAPRIEDVLWAPPA